MPADQLTVGTDYALARRLQRNLDRATVDRVTLLELLGGGEVRVRLADPKLRAGRDGTLVASTRALVRTWPEHEAREATKRADLEASHDADRRRADKLHQFGLAARQRSDHVRSRRGGGRHVTRWELDGDALDWLLLLLEQPETVEAEALAAGQTGYTTRHGIYRDHLFRGWIRSAPLLLEPTGPATIPVTRTADGFEARMTRDQHATLARLPDYQDPPPRDLRVRILDLDGAPILEADHEDRA